jgi:enoyl-CoA hydratase/carnithine racemase
MIRVEDDAGVRLVTLDRPGKANALSRDMLAALVEAVEGAEQAGARALVLTGTGKAFSAGMDFDAAAGGLATDPVWERLSGAIVAFPGLSVAALNGTAAGGSLGMVLACDLRVAVPAARLFYPVMRLGFLPQPSDPARLVALVGPSRARLVLMGGQRIEAAEALAWGLVDRIAAPEALLDTARALAADTVSAAPDHAAAIKRMLRAADSGQQRR